MDVRTPQGNKVNMEEGETKWKQEPMTRSLQLSCVRVTAFSQTDLFLD